MSIIELTQLQQEIRTCDLCVRAGHIPAAYPILHGSERARIMILGQAPGPSASKRPLPYSGPSGRTLRGWLQRAGFEEDALYDPERFYLTSVTKCFPGRATSGKGDRAPSRAEIELCSRHLDRELTMVRPELILALGRLSIGTMVRSLRALPLAKIIGRAVPAEYPAAAGALVLPLPHPSGVSRWHNEPANQAMLADALRWLGAERIRRNW
ncbi:MAG TPA: uracil-DNA glycosylase family protein [Thermomicrobiales bacterium]|nr:uracil-DNA glycosylase family protein [Thermomicrobiales bacterium]